MGKNFLARLWRACYLFFSYERIRRPKLIFPIFIIEAENKIFLFEMLDDSVPPNMIPNFLLIKKGVTRKHHVFGIIRISKRFS